MIRNFTPRLYQQTILNTCTAKNTLVVLPTGLGKTNIFLMVAAHRLREHPQSKILFIGPTRPLIDQYRKVFETHFDLPVEQYATFTGTVQPEKREQQWKTATIIFSTPQGLENDILNKRIDLKHVSLLGIDEAHRATGDYSYVWVAKQYTASALYPRIIGLTASPGSDLEKITEVCRNLFIEDIEVRTYDDLDVKPFVQPIRTEFVKVDLPPEYHDVVQYLKRCFESKMVEMKKLGYLNANIQSYSKKDLLGLQAGMMGELSRGNKDFQLMKSVSLAAEALKVQHALELVETQGMPQVHKYLSSLQEQSLTSKTKAVQNLVKDINFRSALIKSQKVAEQKIKHPKLIKLKELVLKECADDSAKLLVFTQYRDSGSEIVTELNAMPNIKAELFVGQAKKNGTGITQKKQLELIEQFEKGECNVLVMTSVGEEGLDIPKVDTVIFYEPIPSAIRHIQRRGRTGRQKEGKAIILVTSDTRDEGYRWSAHHKEQRMLRTLKTLKERFNTIFKQQPTITQFTQKAEGQKLKIFVDHRERNSAVVKQLFDLGIDIRVEKLESADFILSARCGVEFKTVPDFVNSLIDGRIFDQLLQMKKNFERPFILVEGSEDMYSVRNIHPNAIRGLLASVTIGYGIPIVYTKTPLDSASFLQIVAKREQEDTSSSFTPHAEKVSLSLKKQQEYVVSSLPLVGPNLAKDLLKKFKTIKNIANASEEELKETENIGEKKAKTIKDLFEKEYKES